MDDTDCISPKWFAILTGPREEFNANQNLKRQGYYTWLPFHKIKKYRKRPNRNQYDPIWTLQAYFPRYLFLAMRGRAGESFHDVNETDGVSCVVSCQGVPLEIPHEVMDELMVTADSQGLLGEKDMTRRERFIEGQTVEFIEESPFAGFVATIRVDKGRKVLLWCEQLQAPISAPPEVLTLRA